MYHREKDPLCLLRTADQQQLKYQEIIKYSTFLSGLGSLIPTQYAYITPDTRKYFGENDDSMRHTSEIHRWASTSALMSAISDIDISYSDIGTKNIGLNPFIPILK
jgi:hypothetical protein